MKGLVFTYLLCYGGAAASLFSPFFGLLVYVCFAILKPEDLWHWSVPAGNYSRLVAISLLLGWAIHGFGRWQMRSARGIVLALICFWLWAAVSAVQAPDDGRSRDFLEAMGKIFLPFFVGITLIDSVTKLKQLAWVIVLSQGYVAFELNLAYYDGFNRITEIGFGGMDNNCVAISMVTGVGLAFFLGLNTISWWHKAVAFGAAAVMAHTVLFSFSRGGMIALILTAIMAFFLIRMQPRHYVVLAIAILLGLRLAGPEVRDRFMTTFADADDRDASAQSRLDLWSSCLDAIASRPVFGFGPAHWPLVAEKYGFARGKEAHSLWLQIGAELGLPGLLCLLGFFVLSLVRLWPIARRHTPVFDPWLHGAAAMVVAALFGFIVSAQFVSLVGLELPYYAALVGAGVLKLASSQSAEDPPFIEDHLLPGQLPHSAAVLAPTVPLG